MVALSSCEAELNSAIKGACEMLAARTLMTEWGHEPECLMKGDSSACRGVLLREGLGKLKHISVKQLWVQEAVQSGQVAFEKIPRNINASDLLTHHWGTDAFAHFNRLGFITLPGTGGDGQR